MLTALRFQGPLNDDYTLTLRPIEAKKKPLSKLGGHEASKRGITLNCA